MCKFIERNINKTVKFLVFDHMIGPKKLILIGHKVVTKTVGNAPNMGVAAKKL